MANYQVPTEGACSLNPVNTVYFTVQYTLALSWITPYKQTTCKHLTKLKSWSVS